MNEKTGTFIIKALIYICTYMLCLQIHKCQFVLFYFIFNFRYIDLAKFFYICTLLCIIGNFVILFYPNEKQCTDPMFHTNECLLNFDIIVCNLRV